MAALLEKANGSKIISSGHTFELGKAQEDLFEVYCGSGKSGTDLMIFYGYSKEPLTMCRKKDYPIGFNTIKSKSISDRSAVMLMRNYLDPHWDAIKAITDQEYIRQQLEVIQASPNNVVQFSVLDNYIFDLYEE